MHVFLTTPANIVGEILSLELNSEPLAGPSITLPIDEAPSAVNLSCTVTNQGRFEWQWNLQDSSSSSPSSVWVSDDTRSSTIEIPLGVDAVGNYSCMASYHRGTNLFPSNMMTGMFTVQLESK